MARYYNVVRLVRCRHCAVSCVTLHRASGDVLPAIQYEECLISLKEIPETIIPHVANIGSDAVELFIQFETNWRRKQFCGLS